MTAPIAVNRRGRAKDTDNTDDSIGSAHVQEVRENERVQREHCR